MEPANPKEPVSIKHWVAFYNAVANLFWSVLNLLPIYIFCYRLVEPLWLYVAGGISIITIFLPRAVLNKLQLGTTAAVYHKLGVHYINQVTQNGTFINKLIRKRFPHYKVVDNTRQAVQLHYRKTYMYERFHYLLLCFFTCIIIYALVQQQYSWACLLLLTNILYNVYPVLLQQYVRVKLEPFVPHSSIKKGTLF
jgi:hypothetical protein